MGVLRFFLAFIVLAAHCGWGIGIGGSAAVIAFFMISGFYMAATYTRHYADAPVAFMMSRYLRLFPLYFFTVTATAAVWLMLRPSADPHTVFAYFAEPTNSVAVWSLLGQDLLSTSEVRHHLLPARQAWSISAELAFYALTPLIIAQRSRLVAMIVAAFALKLIIYIGWGERFSYFPFYAQIGYFLLGVLCFFWRNELALRRLVPYALPTLCLFLLVLGPANFNAQQIGTHAAMVAVLFVMLPTLWQIKEGKIASILGDLSYAIYIVHFGIIATLAALGFSVHASPILGSACVLAIAVALGLGFKLTIQDRIDLWRRRYLYKDATSRSVTLPESRQRHAWNVGRGPSARHRLTVQECRRVEKAR